MLPPPPIKSITMPWQHCFSGRGKKKSILATYWRERSELREDRAYDCGCNSGSPLRDAVGSLKKKPHPPLTVYYLNQDNPEPNCPNSRLTACKKAMHAISLWYRTIYILWLVTSYYTHRANVGWILISPKNRGDQRSIHIAFCRKLFHWLCWWQVE